MSKNRYFGKKLTPDEVLKPLHEGAVALANTLDTEVNEDSFAAAKAVLSADGITPGQVYEGVVVPDRAVNTLGLTPGAKLGPLVVEAPYDQTDDGWWVAFFEGEGSTGVRLYVDAAMLRTGRLRK